MGRSNNELQEKCKIYGKTWEKLRDFVFGIRKPSGWLVDGADPDRRYFATAISNTRNQREFEIHFPEGGRNGVQKLTFALDMDGSIRNYSRTFSGLTVLAYSDEFIPGQILSKDDISEKTRMANRDVPALLFEIMEGGVQFPSVASALGVSRSR